MSNGSLGYILAFSIGATAGAVVTWRVLKAKYERIAREEIASVKEVFSKLKPKAETKNGPNTTNDEEKEVEQEKPKRQESLILEYNRKLGEAGYTDYTKYANNPVDTKEVKSVDEPYVIPPEEFDSLGYDTSSLTYWADGVVTDDYDEIVEDVDDIIGKESLDHFGEYENDSVFVRNDILKTDYEILRDSRRYSDVIGD